MSARARLIWLAATASLIAGVVAFGTWAVRERERSAPPPPVSRVPDKWHQFREGEGHVVHVAQQGIACEKCHEPGPTFASPSLQKCASCHASESTIRHAMHASTAQATVGVADCTACHSFGPGAESETWHCIRCHETQQGRLTAVRAGTHDDCSLCHRPHGDPAIDPAPCTQCHRASENTHAGVSSKASNNCLICHEVHGSPAIANERCTSCHDDKPHALFAQGHEQCTTCHTPHAFGKDEVKPCRSCHAGQHVLAESTVTAHAQCTSCHEPHAPQSASDATCRGCHTAVAPKHPETNGHACTGCHAPHPAQASMPVAATCTSCHSALGDDHAAHAGKAACTDCHAPHAFAQPTQNTACAHCHADKLAATAGAPHGGHANCMACHQGHPHDAQLAPLACTHCHANVHPREQHAQCTTCHEPHSGTPLALELSCKNCHAREFVSVAPIEKHRDCLTCHTPHEGGQHPAAQCTQCHAEQAAQNHGKLAGGCTSCHDIHAAQGPLATKTCTSCHAVAKLPGLHDNPNHQACTKCHDGAHDPGPWSERATCIACHADRVNHVPEAKLCQGCHVFSQ
jgi:hypothetical protein